MFCDTLPDGTVAALVLVEYHYADDGTIASVRLVDAATGTDHALQGRLTACPAGVTQPEQDLVLLCDIADDGSATPFLRDYRRDENGVIVGDADYTLDRSPYFTTGVVQTCPDGPQCQTTAVCVRPSGRVEFLSNPGAQTNGSIDADWQWSTSVDGPFFPMYRVGVFPGWTTVDPGTDEGQAHWVAPHPNSGTLNTGQPGEGPDMRPEWFARATFTLPANADPATIRISATVLNADQLAVEWRLNNGAWQTVNRAHNQPPFSLPPTAVPGAQPGVNQIIVHARETVFGSGAAGILLHVIAEYDVDPTSFLLWTQVACTNGTVSYIDDQGARRDTLPDGWSTVPCGGVEVFQHQQVLCDDTGPFLRKYIEAADGSLIDVVNLTLDGGEHIPAGEVQVCENRAGCQTVALCDQTTATETIPFNPTFTGGGTLPNGVDWATVNGRLGAFGQPFFQFLFPGGFRFSELVDLQFDVRFGGPTASCVTLPPGVARVSIDPALTYDPVTRRLCPTATTTQAAVARFTAANVTDLYIDRPDTGQGPPFQDHIEVGNVTVSRTVVTPFLRNLCRDRDGTVDHSDTVLDGATEYIPAGTVVACTGSDTDPGARPFTDTDLVVLCDDGGPFLRKVLSRDGIILGTVDYELDGTTGHTVSGTVGVCSAGQPRCGGTQVVRLCDEVFTPEPPIPVPAATFTLSGSVATSGSTLVFSQGEAPITGVAERTVTGLTGGAVYQFTFAAGWLGGGIPPGTANAIYRVEIVDGAAVLASRERNVSNGATASSEPIPEAPLEFAGPASGAVLVRITDLTAGGGTSRDLTVRPDTVQTADLTVTRTPFLRAITFDCDGHVTATEDTTPAGAEYRTAGTPVDCDTTAPPPAGGTVTVIAGIAQAAAGAPVTVPAGARSVTVTVTAGTADVNGVTVPTGASVTWAAETGEVLGNQITVSPGGGGQALVASTVPG